MEVAVCVSKTSAGTTLSAPMSGQQAVNGDRKTRRRSLLLALRVQLLLYATTAKKALIWTYLEENLTIVGLIETRVTALLFLRSRTE